jgi:hypothetical protein
VPYPRIIPATGSGKETSGCEIEISSEEVDFLNRYLDALNLQIEAAVGVVRSHDTPVYFAKDVVTAFQPDHTICDGDRSYVNSVSFRNPATLFHLFDQEGLHPTAAGYSAMARAISAWSAGQVEMQNPEVPAWSDRVIRDSNRSPVAPTFGPVTPTGGITHITAGGYAPGSNVIMRMYSTPQILGSTTADRDGDIDVTVPLPTDTRLGSHRVVAIGFDGKGALREQTTSLFVTPHYALEAVVLLIVGLGAVAFGVTGTLVSRRDPQRTRAG